MRTRIDTEVGHPFVTARRLETLGAGTKAALPELDTVDEAPRGLRDGDLVR